jgi:hypothetical protein
LLVAYFQLRGGYGTKESFRGWSGMAYLMNHQRVWGVHGK